MKKETLLILFLFGYLIFSFFLLLKANLPKGEIAGKSTSAEAEVSLSIGEFHFTLYGYTSPFALVTISGMGIFDQTTANSNGYFVFKNRFSPFSPREACLTAQDQFGRLTSPVCLPAFPTDYNVEIGPVIMPPTLSLDKNEYWVGDEVVVSGQSIPKTKINLFFFSQKNFPFLNFLAKLNIFKNVYGQSPNSVETKTDEKGNFSLNLSLSQSQKLRIFTQADYEEKTSPESRKLTVEIFPWWLIIFKIFSWLFSVIKSRLLEILILAELIGLLAYFLKKYFHPRTLAIIRRQNLAIVLKNDKKILVASL